MYNYSWYYILIPVIIKVSKVAQHCQIEFYWVAYKDDQKIGLNSTFLKPWKKKNLMLRKGLDQYIT